MYELLALPEESMSDMIEELKLSSFVLEATFHVSKSGDYTIDNLSAERAIRPLTNQRKIDCFSAAQKEL